MNISADFTDPVDKIWADDKLNRRIDAETIRQFTLGHLNLRESAGQDRTYVLNLDADWGAGKTFFLERLKKHLEHHKHIAVYVNAWEDDYSEDPFLTVVDAIQTELESKLRSDNVTDEEIAEYVTPFLKSTSKVLGGALLSGGKHFLARYVGGQAIEEVGKLFEKDAEWTEDSQLDESIQKAVDSAVDATGAELLSNFKIQKAAQGNFRKQLTALAEKVVGSGNVEAPIFVLIDELDRCRPSYAIELLERVKHIFSLRNFVFILGTDTKQLGHAVRGVYGQDFDGPRYLKRFIDRNYSFQTTETSDFIAYKLARVGLDERHFTLPKELKLTEFMSKVLEAGRCSLRDIDQMIDIIATFKAIWPFPDAEIDIVTLLGLVYMQHQSIQKHDWNKKPIGQVNFTFQSTRNAQGSDMVFYQMWSAAGSTLDFNIGSIHNKFQTWLYEKSETAREVFVNQEHSETQRKMPVELYTELLSKVTHISKE